MLKGFVSGEEKDIVRIPMKTRNLISLPTASKSINGVEWTCVDGIISGNGLTTSAAYQDCVVITPSEIVRNGNYPLYYSINATHGIKLPAGTYTFSADYVHTVDTTRLRLIVGREGTSPRYYTARQIFSGDTFTTDGEDYAVLVCGDINTSSKVEFKNIMLNSGSTALPYEPYGYQEGWEVRDNQDRLIWGREDELQTNIGALQLKGYELPVKIKSILGNTVQNGTPSPSPVNPNLVDPSKTISGYQNNNGTIHVPSSGNERTTDWIPFTTDTLYAIVSGSNNGNINWVLYDSNKQPLYFYGPTFSPNTVIIISRGSYSAAAFVRISWTNAINQPICVTTEQRSEYIPFDPNPPGPVMPEFVGVKYENLFDKTGEIYPWNEAELTFSGNTIRATVQRERTQCYAAILLSNTQQLLGKTLTLSATITQSTPTNTGGLRVRWYNGNYPDLVLYEDQSETGYATATFTVPDTIPDGMQCLCILFTANWHGTCQVGDYVEYENVMLNEGDSAEPFIPYGESGWKIPFESHGENLISLPIISAGSDGLTVSSSSESMTLFGNITRIYEDNPIWKRFDFTLDAGEYTLSLGEPRAYQNGYAPRLHKYDDGSVLTNYLINPVTFTLSERTHVYMAFYIDDKQLYNDKWVFKLKKGLAVNEVKPIYLGEVPTIRRIRKAIVDITGIVNISNGNKGGVHRFSETSLYALQGQGYCDIALYDSTRRTTGMFYVNQQNAIFVGDSTDTLETLKEKWNGATFWYVLETPQTGIVNEPLAKIGNYADELTTIQVHGLSAPLYGIGDYKDILNLATGVVTRKIKKLVLTGEENFTEIASGLYRITESGYMRSADTLVGVCSHFGGGYTVPAAPSAKQDALSFLVSASGNNFVYFSPSQYLTPADFKAYLAAQYQNGTPVTIWYVLATPTTETVTVPTGMTGEIEGYLKQISIPTPEHQSIPKWNGEEETGGTYAVTVYNLPEIQTTTGKNTLTVETEKIHGLTNPLCGIEDYKDVLNLSTGTITRKIKKLVLTGEEHWVKSSAYQGSFYAQIVTNLLSENYTAYCSHLTFSTLSQYAKGKFCFNGGITKNCNLWLNQFDSNTTVEELKSYLASQYAAGTPVTVWYVLSAPETETITVPYGLECSVEGYLTQSGTPTPSNPITPDANGTLESGGTYAVEVSLVPSNLTVKGHIKPVQ